MIDKIIAFSINNKLITLLLTLALAAAGIWSMTQIPLDAIPDITNNQVQVITTTPSLATEDVEQFVTYPVELAMSNLPGVTEIRSVSRFGLSVVTIVFEENMGKYLPRQLVSEQLNEVRDEIPEGFGEPFMGPITTGLGEIYQYTLDPRPGYDSVYSLTELRSIQDWLIKRQLSLLPGVVEVNGFGGRVKQYEVALDPDRLNGLKVSLRDVYKALEKGNSNTGGAYIERNHQAVFIRGEGMLRTTRDIENTVVRSSDHAPIRIRDLGEVRSGSAVRYGAATRDGKGEAVGGTIMMLKGANSNEVIDRVKERMVQIRHSLPEGLEINPFLDRSDLIGRTTFTIGRNLVEGALIVIAVLVLLLGQLRGGLIIASVIPLSLLFAFIMMRIFGVWANLMSLGAIDFGIIIDGAVIIVEGISHRLSKPGKLGQPLSRQQMDRLTLSSSSRMMNTAFFGQLIILIVFMPILALEGVEGKMFRPMAYTFGFAVLGAILLCLTYVPCMSALLLQPGKKPGKFSAWISRSSDRLMEKLRAIYRPLLKKALANGKTVLAGAVLLLGLSLFTLSRIGGEFIPQLDEGDIAFHAILKPGSALSETVTATTRIEQLLLKEYPEIEHVFSRIGVSDVPTDPMPMDLADVIVILKPKKEWVSAASKEELIKKMEATLSVLPGINYEFTQPIEMRFNELISGIREDIAVKLYGDDLETLAQKAAEIGQLVSGIEGVADMRVEATSGLPQLLIHYDRERMAQYNITVEELNQVINAAFAGASAGTVFEGEKRFDLVVRLREDRRGRIEDLEQLYVSLPDGDRIPLSALADIRYEPAPMQISRDNTRRRTSVGINVRGRDIESLVAEIRSQLDARLELPPGYYIEFGGAFENLERAAKRLRLVVPLALALIFLLLYFALRSFSQAMMIYMSIPLAAIGGIAALWIRGMPFSISAGVGFVVLFGVAVLNGLVLVSRFNSLKREGLALSKRTSEGAAERLRPVLLTALAAITGFLPMAISTSAGAEVQRPLATVVIGGLITSTLLTLLVLPILYRWTEQYTLKKRRKTMMNSNTLSLMLAMALAGAVLLPKTATAVQIQQTPVMSLQEALEKAVSSYSSIKIAELSVQKEEALKGSNWDMGNTLLYTGMEEAGADRTGIQTLVGISQQNIDLFGGVSRGKWRKALIRLGEVKRHLTELEVRKNTTDAYYLAAFSRSRLKVARELDSLYRRFEEAARLRYETGETPKLEYLTARGKYRAIKLALQQAEDDYQIALHTLAQWTNHDAGRQVMYLEEILPVRSVNTGAGEIAGSGAGANAGTDANVEVGAGSPLLDPFRQNIRLQEARVAVERAELLPKLNGQYALQKSGDQTGIYSWQAGIHLPLWFIPQKSKIKAAKIDKAIAENRLLLEKQKLQTRQQKLQLELKKTAKAISFYQKEGLPLAEEQLQAAEKSYRYGELDYIAFIQLTDEAVRTRLTWFEHLLNYAQTHNQLQFITGNY